MSLKSLLSFGRKAEHISTEVAPVFERSKILANIAESKEIREARKYGRDVVKAIETDLPFSETPASGLTRLYRGEAPGASKLSASSEMHLRGRFFTSRREDAEAYAERASLMSKSPQRMLYVDIPSQDVERYRHVNTQSEYLLPNEHQRRGRILGVSSPSGEVPRNVASINPNIMPTEYTRLAQTQHSLGDIQSKMSTQHLFVKQFSDPKTRETFGVDAADMRLRQAKNELSYLRKPLGQAKEAHNRALLAAGNLEQAEGRFPDLSKTKRKAARNQAVLSKMVFGR